MVKLIYMYIYIYLVLQCILDDLDPHHIGIVPLLNGVLNAPLNKTTQVYGMLSVKYNPVTFF